ncbi:MAG: protoheme IX farnesyltransferase [Deltaproteobacteria bacterium]|nr:protoheme IX farnesyltransferase [Deltaproteobacteria bacterium]HCH61574.1 protoheme IX farnesyltransferase [Deltaproteobacteria bacterium]
MSPVAPTLLQSPATTGPTNDTLGAAPQGQSAVTLPARLRDLFALAKPRLSLLVLVTAGGGLGLAPASVDLVTGAAAVLGTTMVVGGANALNCYLERDCDRLMGRTRSRPLPAGRMAPRTALLFGVGLSLASVPMLTLLTTPLAGLLAAIALLSYVVVYTPMKRRSSVSTLVGALPGALPPLIGWTAATGSLDAGGLALFALLFLWQIPHSLAIGIYRGPEYEKAGLKVFPNEHGLHATRLQALLYTTPLVAIPLLLVHLGIGGWATLIAGATLGTWFFALALQGFRHQGEARWARRFFMASLVYLSGLFVALGADGIWQALA